jgi:hypothetical protein
MMTSTLLEKHEGSTSRTEITVLCYEVNLREDVDVG